MLTKTLNTHTPSSNSRRTENLFVYLSVHADLTDLQITNHAATATPLQRGRRRCSPTTPLSPRHLTSRLATKTRTFNVSTLLSRSCSDRRRHRFWRKSASPRPNSDVQFVSNILRMSNIYPFSFVQHPSSCVYPTPTPIVCRLHPATCQHPSCSTSSAQPRLQTPPHVRGTWCVVGGRGA
jgi:hypothetical protein